MTEPSIQPVARVALIALMAFFSVMLWIGIPLGWLWIVSQVQSSTQAAGFGPYLMTIAGIARLGGARDQALGRAQPRLRARLRPDGDRPSARSLAPLDAR